MTVSVDRPGKTPLPVRLRLIPARTAETAGVAELAEVPDESVSVSSPTPLRVTWPKRAASEEDGFVEPEYGGSD